MLLLLLRMPDLLAVALLHWAAQRVLAIACSMREQRVGEYMGVRLWPPLLLLPLLHELLLQGELLLCTGQLPASRLRTCACAPLARSREHLSR